MINSRKLIVASILSISLWGCASTDEALTPISAPISNSANVGHVSEAGIVVNWSTIVQPDYERYMGRECVSLLKRMKNPLYKAINHSECNPLYQNNPYYAGFCQQSAREVQQVQALEAKCLAKKQAYDRQVLDVRIVKSTTDSLNYKTLSIIGSGQLEPSENKIAIALQPQEKAAGGRCAILTNALGERIPVRGMQHADRYHFSVAHVVDRSERMVAKQHVQQAQAHLAKAKEIHSRAKTLLENSPAHRQGQCVKPVQEPIPPKPDGLWGSELDYQVESSCIDLMMRRYNNNNHVEKGLLAIGLDEQLMNWLEWRQKPSKQASCAKNALSQAETIPIALVCKLGGDTLSSFCAQQTYQICTVAARKKCGAKQDAWKREVARIKAAPQKALQACRSKQALLTQRKAILEEELRNVNRATVFNSQRQAQPMPTVDRISLENATCTPFTAGSK